MVDDVLDRIWGSFTAQDVNSAAVRRIEKGAYEMCAQESSATCDKDCTKGIWQAVFAHRSENRRL